MKIIILCLLITSSLMFSQQDDKFMRLDSNDRFSFNSPFNQKYQIFPQFKNLYQGFIVKPYERQGYYAWLQLKQDGYLKDTIIWVDDSFVQTLFSKLPNPQSESLGIDDNLLERAKMLSFAYNRTGKKLNDSIKDSDVINDSANFYSSYISSEYIKFREIIQDEDWEVKTVTSKYNDVALKGKIHNNLIISKDIYKKSLDIGKIVSIQHSRPSLWYLGLLLGLPVGAVAGGGIGYELDTESEGGAGGAFVGGLVGLIGGGIFGAWLIDKINKDPEIKLTSSDPYDKYFELDSKTYFTLQELPSDSNRKNLTITDTASKARAATEEELLVENEKAKKNELNKSLFSLGVGFLAPLNYNLNILFYFNEYFGLGYTGFPVVIHGNDDWDCSRLGLFYRIHSGKQIFDNIGISYSSRTISFYSTWLNANTKINYHEIGVFYDFSIYGIFIMGGLNLKISGYIPSDYALPRISFNFQFGYRYTF